MRGREGEILMAMIEHVYLSSFVPATGGILQLLRIHLPAWTRRHTHTSDEYWRNHKLRVVIRPILRDNLETAASDWDMEESLERTSNKDHQYHPLAIDWTLKTTAGSKLQVSQVLSEALEYELVFVAYLERLEAMEKIELIKSSIPRLHTQNRWCLDFSYIDEKK